MTPNITQLSTQFSPEIDKTLATELLEDYTEIKRNYNLQRYELTINKAGKFCETVFQILEFIKSGKMIKEPNFTKISKELEQSSKDAFPESIRTHIPRTATLIYAIRSKRGTAHKRKEVSPNYMDCSLVVSACDWILSEFLRLYHTADPNEIQNTIHKLVDKNVPFIEEFGGDIVILDEKLSSIDDILLTLYHFYPEFVPRSDLNRYLKHRTPPVLSRWLKKIEEERLIYHKNGLFCLTKKGIQVVEAKHQNRLLA